MGLEMRQLMEHHQQEKFGSQIAIDADGVVGMRRSRTAIVAILATTMRGYADMYAPTYNVVEKTADSIDRHIFR